MSWCGPRARRSCGEAGRARERGRPAGALIRAGIGRCSRPGAPARSRARRARSPLHGLLEPRAPRGSLCQRARSVAVSPVDRVRAPNQRLALERDGYGRLVPIGDRDPHRPGAKRRGETVTLSSWITPVSSAVTGGRGSLAKSSSPHPARRPWPAWPRGHRTATCSAGAHGGTNRTRRTHAPAPGRRAPPGCEAGCARPVAGRARRRRRPLAS